MRDPVADSYSNRDSDTYTHTHTYTYTDSNANGYNHAETCPNAQAAPDSAPPTMS